jgi:hypothetical protein
VVQRLNGPLPEFPPQFLSQCILAGKIVLVHAILMALYKTLKFWVAGDQLDDYLGLRVEDFYEVDHVGFFSLLFHSMLSIIVTEERGC